MTTDASDRDKPGSSSGAGVSPGRPPSGPHPSRRILASDNAAGAHPKVLEALARANEGHALAYGHDEVTARATACFRRHFGEEAQVAFVFGGTGANVVGLSAAVASHQSVLCADTAHLWRDECAAPERFLGAKLTPIPGADGKLKPEDLEPHLGDLGIVHRAQPKAVSVTQATELGTVYTSEELKRLGDFAQAHGLVLHLDGARLAQAAASLEVPLRAITTDAGVDVVSFGGTKNGILFGEAIVFLKAELAAQAGWLQKQGMQLPSKMRFVAAQFEALLEGELWLENARHANSKAKKLEAGLRQVPGVEIAYPVESNAVFCRLPPEVIEPLQKLCYFHVWDPKTSVVRLMTSFDSGDEEIDAFVAAARKLLA